MVRTSSQRAQNVSPKFLTLRDRFCSSQTPHKSTPSQPLTNSQGRVGCPVFFRCATTAYVVTYLRRQTSSTSTSRSTRILHTNCGRCLRVGAAPCGATSLPRVRPLGGGTVRKQTPSNGVTTLRKLVCALRNKPKGRSEGCPSNAESMSDK